MDTFAEYQQHMQRQFASYGFTGCPLSASELRYLWRWGFSYDEAYSIGCDVNAGFPFNDALTAVLKARDTALMAHLEKELSI